MSQTLLHLDNEISTISVEIISDKAQLRQKAFDKIDFILNNRKDELLSLFSGKVVESVNTWDALFQSIFLGILKVLNKVGPTGEFENKGTVCIIVIQKLLKLANNNSENIKGSSILKKVFEIFDNEAHKQHAGYYFVKILQHNVLDAAFVNKNGIKPREWDKIVLCCLDLYGANLGPRLTTVQCIEATIKCALEQSFFSSTLHQYLPRVKEFLMSAEKGAIQNEWLQVSYIVCFNIAADHRFLICGFVEEVAKILHKAYDSNMAEKMKETIFKFMHLSLIIHSPKLNLLNASTATTDHFEKETEWYKSLRNYFYDVTLEMRAVSKKKNLSNSEPTINDVFLQFAKRLCLMIFWNENIWSGSSTGEQASKKQKHCNGLQSIIDLVSEGNNSFSWGWLVVLAEVVIENPQTINKNNFLVLLQLLSDFQSTIQYSVQLEAMYKCCSTLLYTADSLVGEEAAIDAELSDGLWKKIFDSTSRSCMSGQLHPENHCLLQLMIKHKKCITDDFIISLIANFELNSIKKTNISLTTLVEIMKTYNLESIKDYNALIKSLLNFNHQTSKTLNLKTIIMNDGKIDSKIVAKLSVMCILSKTDVINFEVDTEREQPFVAPFFTEKKNNDYINSIKNVERLLLLKSMGSFIFETKPLAPKTEAKVSAALQDELKCVIDEDLFEYLRNIMQLDKAAVDRSKQDELVHNTETMLSNIGLYLQILNELMRFQSLNYDKFQKCILTKKTQFYLQELEVCFESIMTESLTANEIFSLLQKLEPIFDVQQHDVLCGFLRSNKLTATISWVAAQVEKHNPRNEQCTIMEYQNFENLSMKSKIRFESLKLLVFYIQHGNGLDEAKCITTITETEYKFNRNCDIYCLLNLMKMIGQHVVPSLEMADWMLRNIMDLCRYYTNESITKQLVLLFADVLKFISIRPDCTNNIGIAVKSFIGKSARKSYSVQLTLDCLEQIRYLFQSYPMDLENSNFNIIYNKNLVELLHCAIFSINIKTAEVFGHIMQFGYSCTSETPKEVIKFQSNLFAKIDINRMIGNYRETPDGKENMQSVFLHLLSTLIKCNYSMRDELLITFAEFCFTHSLNEDKIRAIMTSIVTYLNCTLYEFMSVHLFDLMSCWLAKKHPVSGFPWYMTTSESLNDFVSTNINLIIFAAIRKTPDQLTDLAELLHKDIPQLLQPVLSDVFAYLTPRYVENLQMSSQYTVEAQAVHQAIVQYNISIDQKFTDEISDVTLKLFENLIDADRMKLNFNVDFRLVEKDHNINYDKLVQCLAYLKASFMSLKMIRHFEFCIINAQVYEFIENKNPLKKFLTPSTNNNSLIHHLCITDPGEVERMILSFKTKLQFAKIVEEKLKIAFQFSIFIEFLADYLNHARKTEKLTCKDFIVRDITYFFCYKISTKDDTEKQLCYAMCYFFNNFLREILPDCSKEFKPVLNHVVSTLLPICDDESSNISKLAHGILTFLIVDQNNELDESIAALDNFPNRPIFDAMRQSHALSKYKGNDFTLQDEIKHFLQNDRRKLEGLMTLKLALAKNKDDLIALYANLNNIRGFSEDCETSDIHRLINTLVLHTQSKEMQRSLEAAKCLGEIGPANLQTIVLTEEKKSLTYGKALSSKEIIASLCSTALEKLNNLLVHPDVIVLKAVSDAAFYLMSMKSMHKHAEKYVYLKPYISSKNSAPLEPSSQNFKLSKQFEEMANVSYPEWIKALCCEMFLFFSDTYLHQVVMLQLSFAETMLPLLVQSLLSFQTQQIRTDLEFTVTTFFSKHVLIENTVGPASSKSIHSNKLAIKALLSVVESIRVYSQRFPSEKINLNYLHIAKAALFCKAFFSAILYCELWVLDQVLLSATKDSEELIKSNEVLQTIMIEAYMSIGIDDAVYPFVDPLKLRTVHLQLQNSWNRVLLENDALCGFNKNFGNEENLINNLKSSGLYVTAYSMNKGHDQPKMDYECAWRLGDWSLLPQSDVTVANDMTRKFEKDHYTALKCLYNKDEAGIELSLTNARKTIVESLKSESLECTNTLYKYLRMLQQIQQIEDFCDVQFHKFQEAHEKVLQKWSSQDKMQYYFTSKEALLAQRLTIFNATDKRAQRTWTPEAVQETLLNLIVMSKNEGRFNIAMRNVAAMRAMELTPERKAKLVLEDAQINLSLGDNNLGKCLLLSVINNEEFQGTMLKAEALRLYGSFLADIHQNDSKFIQNNYYKLASEIFACHKKQLSPAEKEKHIVIYETIAKHSDKAYTELNAHINSSTYQQKIKFIEKNEEAVNLIKIKALATKGVLTKDESKQYTILKKTAENDREELKLTEKNRDDYLTCAALYYIENAINNAKSTNLSVFRVISLWLSNADDKKMIEMVEEFFTSVPSHKLIVILPQIGARMGDNNENIAKFVSFAFEKCAKAHPHHTLPHIFALANAHADDPNCKSTDHDSRFASATELLNKLEGEADLRLIIDEFQKLNAALLKFGNNFDAKVGLLPSTELIKKIRNLHQIYCSTMNIPVEMDCIYDNVVGIQKYKDKWELCGGINAPKKLYCICTDGIERIQLLKGKDDLRQDAVMQQVFVIMNSFLKLNKNTNERKLQVRTYKVVPLAQRTGILEWCSNTMPIGLYLLKAHPKYRPKDLNPLECRKIMTDYSTRSEKTKMKHYSEICQKFKPVFHYFFLEHFLNPGVWFERVQHYTNSVATNSMIGYILGIGDRHVQNILIDEHTAELIHIDFGIAFEQGRILPHPEMIPFRLTRDIISAMGMGGVEGVFRRSCEKTLDVLRQNQETILTILEVLLYDPLYAWTLTSEKAYKCQEIDVGTSETIDNTERNTMADRTISRLREKLNGKHENALSYSSVNGQVDCLITQATNSTLLYKLFPGWQPYL